MFKFKYTLIGITLHTKYKVIRFLVLGPTLCRSLT
jgi:hypothetical protein